MENVVPKPIFRRTEEAKQTDLRKKLEILHEHALNSGHYSTKLPTFVIMTFLKFTPGAECVQWDEQAGDYVVKNHRLYYKARATLPPPLWGSNVYVMDSGSKDHVCAWSLPQLARKSPIYTLQRAIKAGRPKFELDCIVKFMNGELEKMYWEYNLNSGLEKMVKKLISSGDIPLVTTEGRPYM